MNDQFALGMMCIRLRHNDHRLEAYLCQDMEGKPENGILLGSIARRFCDDDKAIFDGWFALMQTCVTNMLKTLPGVTTVGVGESLEKSHEDLREKMQAENMDTSILPTVDPLAEFHEQLHKDY